MNGSLAGDAAGYSPGPMSEYLAAAAAALKVPEAMVLRSAAARAGASGTTAEEVLKAWAGGASPVATQLASPAPSAVPAPITPTSAVSETPAGGLAATVAPPPAQVVVSPELGSAVEEGELAPPAPLRERLRAAGRLGGWVGAVLGLMTVPAASSFLLPLASVSGEPDALVPVVELPSDRFLWAAAAVSVVFGVTVALVSRRLAAWGGRGMVLQGGLAGTVAVGIGSGAVLGLIGATLLIGAFGTVVDEGLVAVPLVTLVAVVAIGGGILGWLTAALIQVVGVPETIGGGEASEVTAVRRRLISAAAIPLTGLLMLVVFVLPLGFVLVRFHEVAPLIAFIAAGGILAFAGLSASRPGMKISFGEFLVAVAGVGVLVLIVVAVVLARGGDEPTPETPANAVSQQG